MKILHIIPSFASGGAEHVVLNYLIDWKKYSEDSVMALSLYGKTGSINDEIIEQNSLNVVYADCEYNNKKQIINAIRKAIKSFKPDIIHSHMRILPYVYLAAIGKKVRIIHTIHTDPEVNSDGKIFYFDKYCFKRKKVQPICLNIEMAKKANKLYGITKTEYLYNGIRISEYSGLQSEDKARIRQSIGIGKDEKVVGHVGRFVKIKNQRLIIEVFSEYLKEHSNSKLLLIGEGPELEINKKLAKEKHIEDRVIFAGARADVPKLLQIMDVYIFPSVVEGLGISVIEAQAACLPCVISDIIPKEAVVSDNVIRVGLDEDVSKWVEALDGKRSKEPFYSIEMFDIKNINDKLRFIYNNEHYTTGI